MPNALARETSPYLLQHRDNPVDWLPWGDEALSRARELDRPLLVSIGYSSCHWCHVMERESFEDAETAALMNDRFVCVKVDREERPDVDALYMDAVQAMTGHGGWPLNVFLTPEQAPFYGGTYFPPEARMGMPSWRQVLGAVAEAWETQREEIRAQGERVAPRLAGGALLTASEQPLQTASLDDAVATLRQGFDSVNGGWGGPPKFPQASVIEFLLARDERPMALQTLRSMAGGGIFDQVGGGFSRYSVDARWTVPHFEKMLYDNALLARAYLHAFQAARRRAAAAHRRGDARLGPARDARPRGRLLQRAGRRLRGRGGQVLRLELDELRAALGDDADAAIAWFGATERGNFEGANILESRGPEPPAEQRDTDPHDAARRSRRARSPWPRRQAPGRLERAHDRRAGRRRRGARPRGLPRRRARRRRLRARAYAHARRAPAAHLQRRRRRGWAPTSRTTPSCSRRCSCSTRRPSRSAGSSRRARWPTRSSRASATPSAAASSRRPTTTRRSSRGARTSRTRRSRRAPRAPRSGLLRLAALTGERGYEEQAAGPARAAARGRRPPPGRVRPPAPGPRPLPRAAARGRPGGRPGGRRGAGGRRPRGAPAAPRARGRSGRRADRGGAPGAAHARRRPRRGLRVRALRLPHAGHRARRAAGRCSRRLMGAGPPDGVRGRRRAAPAREAPPPKRVPRTLKATGRPYSSCAGFFSGVRARAGSGRAPTA